MAIVIRNGKRYRFEFPFTVGRYTVTRYAPAAGRDGGVNPNDLLIFVSDATTNLEVEFDDLDARQLDEDISAYRDGKVSPEQFIARIDEWLSDIQ